MDVLQSTVIKYSCIVGLIVAVIFLEGNDDPSIFVKPAFNSQSPVELSTLRNEYGVALFHAKSIVELVIALYGLLQLQLVLIRRNDVKDDCCCPQDGILV